MEKTVNLYAKGAYDGADEGMLLHKFRRQAKRYSDSARGRRMDGETVEHRVNETRDARKLKDLPEPAEGPRYNQEHKAFTMPTTLMKKNAEEEVQWERDFVNGDRNLQHTADERVEVDDGKNLETDTMDMQGDMATDLSGMNGKAVMHWPRWQPGELVKTPSEARSKAGRPCCGCYVALDRATVAEKANRALPFETCIKMIMNALVPIVMIHADVVSTESMSTRAWSRRKRVAVSGWQTQSRMGTP